jgi:hypothetical protein
LYRGKQRRNSMSIDEIMDCVGCEDLHHIQGRTWGDPDSCYPDEDTCGKGAPENGPCGRMLGAIEDMIHDGELETSAGFMASGEFLAGCTLEDIGFSDESPPLWWDSGLSCISSASYYFISFDPDVCPVMYKDVESVYKEFFV